ncbi:MAG: flagellar hook-associated protein FlgL [Desulfobacteraceae bacterium]|nr:flagellar hook-associated protein FlgL [Desulfobacteraceae bacterium]
MKATLAMNYRTLSSNLESMSNRLYDLRQEAATGKKMNRPSDNPSAIRPLLNYQMRAQSTDRYLDQIKTSQGNMQVLDSNLDQIENTLVAAKEATIAVQNGSVNDTDRQTYADKISQLFDEMLQAGNTQVNGKYVFSGYQDTTQAFTVNTAYDPAAYDPTDASTWAVQYHGDDNSKSVEIAPGKQIQVGLTGNELFLGDADNDSELDTSGTDLFSTLKNLERAIRANDAAGIEAGMGELEQGADQVRRLRGKMGNNAWRIERAGQQLEDASIEFEEIISGYEDADVLEVFSELVQHETAFEAALNVTTRISKLSILNYM